MTAYAPVMPNIRPGRRFLRFDRLFNDAVRSKKYSAIVEVLLRVQVPADNARRTAEKILAEQHSKAEVRAPHRTSPCRHGDPRTAVDYAVAGPEM